MTQEEEMCIICLYGLDENTCSLNCSHEYQYFNNNFVVQGVYVNGLNMDMIHVLFVEVLLIQILKYYLVDCHLKNMNE